MKKFSPLWLVIMMMIALFVFAMVPTFMNLFMYAVTSFTTTVLQILGFGNADIANMVGSHALNIWPGGGLVQLFVPGMKWPGFLAIVTGCFQVFFIALLRTKIPAPKPSQWNWKSLITLSFIDLFMTFIVTFLVGVGFHYLSAWIDGPLQQLADLLISGVSASAVIALVWNGAKKHNVAPSTSQFFPLALAAIKYVMATVMLILWTTGIANMGYTMLICLIVNLALTWVEWQQ